MLRRTSSHLLRQLTACVGDGAPGMPAAALDDHFPLTVWFGRDTNDARFAPVSGSPLDSPRGSHAKLTVVESRLGRFVQESTPKAARLDRRAEKYLGLRSPSQELRRSRRQTSNAPYEPTCSLCAPSEPRNWRTNIVAHPERRRPTRRPGAPGALRTGRISLPNANSFRHYGSLGGDARRVLLQYDSPSG